MLWANRLAWKMFCAKRGLVTGLIGRWKSDPGFWSLVDQGCVSAGNFITTILLARALTPSEYGIYALLFALMLFAVTMHSAAIVYGLSLYGAAGTGTDLGPLVGGSLVLTVGLGTVLGALAATAAAFFQAAPLAPWIFLALLLWQVQETTRRGLMSTLRHGDAVWGDALSYLGQAALLGYAFAGHRLTLAFAFQSMAGTSLVASIVQVVQLRVRLGDFRGALSLVPRFWRVGRWALLVGLAQVFIGQALLWFLALRQIADVASFQSLLNLVRVTNPVMFAVGSVVLPTVAARRSEPVAAFRAARSYALLGASMLVPYLAVISVFPDWVLRIVYGANSAYAGLGVDLRILILGSAFAYVGHNLGMYYFGLSRSDVVFHCNFASAVTTVVTGVVLVREAGVLGSTVAYDLTFAAAMASYAWFLRRDARSPTAEAMAIGQSLDIDGMDSR